MKTPYTKFLLICINVLVLSLFANALSDLFPVAKLTPLQIILILLVLFVIGLITAKGIERLDRRTENSQALEASAQATAPRFKGGFARMKQALYRWWEKFIKLMVLWRATIRQAREKTQRGWARYVLPFAGLGALLFWFSARSANNSDWEQPSDYAQVDWLENAAGRNRNELTIQLGHFGAEIGKKDDPHTILLQAGFGDSLFTIPELRQYLKIAPDNVPRSNLTVRLSPAKSSMSLRAGLEALARRNRVKKVSEHPPVYTLELYAKTSGNEQPYMRRYNFRERTTFEVGSFVLGCVLLLLALGQYLAIPKMPERTASYDQFSDLFRKLFLTARRILKVALLLKYRIAKVLEELTSVLNKSIKIFEDTDQNREPAIAPLLKKQLELVHKEFGPAGAMILNRETAAQLEQRFLAIFRIIEMIDHVVIIVHDDRGKCQKLLEATAGAVDEAHKCGDKLVEENNARIREHRETHERAKSETLLGIREDINDTFNSSDFRDLLEVFIYQRGKYLGKKKGFTARKVRGKGYGSLDIDVELPGAGNEILPIELRRKDEKCLITALEALTLEIPAPTSEQAESKIKYKLLFKDLILTPPYALPENVADLISLAPVDPSEPERLYKEKTLDEFEI